MAQLAQKVRQCSALIHMLEVRVDKTFYYTSYKNINLQFYGSRAFEKVIEEVMLWKSLYIDHVSKVFGKSSFISSITYGLGNAHLKSARV